MRAEQRNQQKTKESYKKVDLQEFPGELFFHLFFTSNL